MTGIARGAKTYLVKAEAAFCLSRGALFGIRNNLTVSARRLLQNGAAS